MPKTQEEKRAHWRNDYKILRQNPERLAHNRAVQKAWKERNPERMEEYKKTTTFPGGVCKRDLLYE